MEFDPPSDESARTWLKVQLAAMQERDAKKTELATEALRAFCVGRAAVEQGNEPTVKVEFHDADPETVLKISLANQLDAFKSGNADSLSEANDVLRAATRLFQESQNKTGE